MRQRPTRTLERVSGRWGSVLALGIAIGCSIASLDASAHVIMGTKSLHLRVAEADLIVRARVIDPEAIFVSADGRTRRELVEVEVLEILKGRVAAKRIRFAQDGHEVARYRTGQEALFFLQPIADSRELRALAVAGGPTHVSGQEHDELFLIEAPHGDILLSVIKSLIASESAATASERVALIRRATLAQLTSSDPRLASSGLTGLVLTPDAALVSAADLPRLEPVLSDPTLSIGFRAGLLAELERRGLVDGSTRWMALLESASPAELPAAIRAVGNHSSEVVKFHLLALLANPDTPVEIAAEAAIALGNFPYDDEVPTALGQALQTGSPRLRNAAIRGLARIDNSVSRAVLEAAAKSHPDPATRNRAAAELRSGQGR